MYYKNKTKAYEKQFEIYGSYTRVFGDDVNDRYYYQSNFANGYNGIWFSCTKWLIGSDSKRHKGKCVGRAKSNYSSDKCVHEIDFDWKYSDFPNWPNAGEGLSVKCLYEPGTNC